MRNSQSTEHGAQQDLPSPKFSLMAGLLCWQFKRVDMMK
jgi:hypothetical protein